MPETSIRQPQFQQARESRAAPRPFFGLIDPVIAPDPVSFDFDGAVSRKHADAIWTWMARDLAPDLIERRAVDQSAAAAGLSEHVPELLARARAASEAAALNLDAERRFRTQLGGEDAWTRIPIVLLALKSRLLLEKAQGFGRAVNGIAEEADLVQALEAMPLNDPTLAALLLQAAAGQVTTPTRLITAAIRGAGGASEAALTRAGFAPLIDAALSQAQSQIASLNQAGPFPDIDLVCCAIDRFHRLVRGINAHVELERLGRWSMVLSALTKTVSERIEPWLRNLVPDLNLAMRRHRDGADRLDSEQLLAALNGCYVLATVRDCRDSLALDALFEETWVQVGQALDGHMKRGLETLRQNPQDTIAAGRLEVAIKMAELRFTPDYAEMLMRARDAILARA